MVIASVSPNLNNPSATALVTEFTVGTIPSITSALFTPSAPVESGSGKVRLASLPAASRTEPPFSVREVVSA